MRSSWRSSNPLRLVVTYHPILPNLERTIRRYHHIPQDSERLLKAFPSFPIIIFWRPKNVRDLLVHIDITSKTSDPSGNFHCEASSCKTCPILVTTDTFSSSVTGEHFQPKLHTSCKTSNVIYLIRCRGSPLLITEQLNLILSMKTQKM